MQFLIQIASIVVLARASIAAVCECYTATTWSTASNCKDACSVVLPSSAPGIVPECPKTPTVTSTMTCPTKGYCFIKYNGSSIIDPSDWSDWADCKFTKTPEATVSSPTTKATASPTKNTKTTRRSTIGSITMTSQSPVIPRPTSPGDCRPLKEYKNPYTIPLDSSSSFLNATIISNLAETPVKLETYQLAFKNMYGTITTKSANRLKKEITSTYDPDNCAFECDQIQGCESFNIFFERLPVLVPSEDCPTPRATVRVVCTYWDRWLDPDMATYKGEQRESFDIRIAGSNAYNRYMPNTTVTSPKYNRRPQTSRAEW